MQDPERDHPPERLDAHRLSVRVYFEDTDFSGRVYHASYLRFLERGRTEWLRSRGFEQRELAAGSNLVFVVHRIEVDYLRPALMDDLLTVITQIEAVGAASVIFRQSIARGDSSLVKARVAVAALADGRPRRLPKDMLARFAARNE